MALRLRPEHGRGELGGVDPGPRNRTPRPRRARSRNSCSIEATCATRTRPDSPAKPVQHVLRLRGLLEVDGAEAVDRMVSGGGMRAGFTSAETSPPGRARPSVRDRREGHDLVPPRVETGRLEVDDAEAGETPRRAGRRELARASSAAGVLGFTLTRR